MATRMVTQISPCQPQDMSSPWVGEPYHGAVRSKTAIALSIMEAEYVACSLATHEAMWLRSFLQDLSLTPRVDDPVEMLCDSHLVH